MYAIKHYDNPGCHGIKDFQDDLKRLRYIKRLLGRYRATGNIKERLIINHLVIFYKVFGVEAATRMLTEAGEAPFRIGHLEASSGPAGIRIENLPGTWPRG